jgi:hypothetical protein
MLSAANALRARERLPLRDVDRREVDDLEERLRDRFGEGDLLEARTAAQAVDVAAALAILREELSVEP